MLAVLTSWPAWALTLAGIAGSAVNQGRLPGREAVGVDAPPQRHRHSRLSGSAWWRSGRFRPPTVCCGGTFRNVAVSGATAATLRHDQLEAAIDHRPDLASLIVGLNDTTRADWDLRALREDIFSSAEALHGARALLLTARFHDHGNRPRAPGCPSPPDMEAHRRAQLGARRGHANLRGSGARSGRQPRGGAPRVLVHRPAPPLGARPSAAGVELRNPPARVRRTLSTPLTGAGRSSAQPSQRSPLAGQRGGALDRPTRPGPRPLGRPSGVRRDREAGPVASLCGARRQGVSPLRTRSCSVATTSNAEASRQLTWPNTRMETVAPGPRRCALTRRRPPPAKVSPARRASRALRPRAPRR